MMRAVNVGETTTGTDAAEEGKAVGAATEDVAAVGAGATIAVAGDELVGVARSEVAAPIPIAEASKHTAIKMTRNNIGDKDSDGNDYCFGGGGGGWMTSVGGTVNNSDLNSRAS